jgi:Ca2+/H+ antiporter
LLELLAARHPVCVRIHLVSYTLFIGVNPNYSIKHVAPQHKNWSSLMYLIAIGWLYVALMMAVAEATSSSGSVLGALITFVLYGVAPVSLVMYIMGTPGRRRVIKAREAAELAQGTLQASHPPDSGRETAADPVAPVRKEP